MNDIDVTLGCADSNFTKASVTGVLAAEVRRLREENERLRKDAERFNWIALNVKEQPSPESLHGEFAEHKTMYVLPKLIAWADFCGNIPFTEAVDYAIDAARGAK